MSVNERIQAVLEQIDAQRPEALIVPYEDHGKWKALVRELPYANRPKQVIASPFVRWDQVILVPKRAELEQEEA